MGGGYGGGGYDGGGIGHGVVGVDVVEYRALVEGMEEIWIDLDTEEGVGAEVEVGKDYGEGMGIIRYIVICLHIDYYLD
jgi:hypothetical protein